MAVMSKFTLLAVLIIGVATTVFARHGRHVRYTNMDRLKESDSFKKLQDEGDAILNESKTLREVFNNKDGLIHLMDNILTEVKKNPAQVNELGAIFADHMNDADGHHIEHMIANFGKPHLTPSHCLKALKALNKKYPKVLKSDKIKQALLSGDFTEFVNLMKKSHSTALNLFIKNYEGLTDSMALNKHDQVLISNAVLSNKLVKEWLESGQSAAPSKHSVGLLTMASLILP
eukprot:369136_1